MGSVRSSGSLKMVVKTELCNYSGFRIYPGHDKKFVRGDQKMFTFINAKSERCFKMKRRSKKTVVRQREIVGLTAEMLEKKRAARPAQKDKQKDAALKELKSRKGAKKGTKK